MLLRLKLRFGALMMIGGGVLALIGEFLNTWNSTPDSGMWFFSLALIVLGTIVLLYGASTYAQLSDSVNLLGVVGVGLLFLGGIAMVIGSVAIDAILLPIMAGLATAIGASINGLGSTAQNATNTVSSGINNVTSSITGAFGQSSSNANIPSVQVPQVNGADLLNKALTGMHLPTLDVIAHWGQIFLTGGPLSLGCVIFGASLLIGKNKAASQTGYILVICGGLNLISQFLTFLPALSHITGLLLFASLIWLGLTVLIPALADKLPLQQVTRFFKRTMTRFTGARS
ncbi:MAG TPA: hypothetical protein VKY19_10920 [Ktedonosporobacter sp.]|jgi:hypothetical protein|nr:hypothetical protein [Ktedonosporobacter sp.]